TRNGAGAVCPSLYRGERAVSHFSGLHQPSGHRSDRQQDPYGGGRAPRSWPLVDADHDAAVARMTPPVTFSIALAMGLAALGLAGITAWVVRRDNRIEARIRHVQ